MNALKSHRSADRRRSSGRRPLATSMLVARVLEGFREPASMLAELISPAPPATLRPVSVRSRRDQPFRAPPR